MSWFNAHEHDPNIGSPSMPVGRYPVLIISTEQRLVRTGDGGMLTITAKVIAGEHTNRSGAFNISVWGKDDTQRRIAAQQLSAIGHCTGVYNFDIEPPRGPHGAELIGKELILEFIPQKDNDKYVNLVGIFDINNNPPSRVGQGIQAVAPSSPPQSFAQPVQTAQAQPGQGQPTQPQTQPANAPSWPPQEQQQQSQTAPQGRPAWEQNPSATQAVPSWAQNPSATQAVPSWAQNR